MSRVFRALRDDWESEPRYFFKKQEYRLSWANVSKVCKTWREVALSDQGLWLKISIDDKMKDPDQHAFTFFSRGGVQKIEIYYFSSQPFLSNIRLPKFMDALGLQPDRLKMLHTSTLLVGLDPDIDCAPRDAHFSETSQFTCLTRAIVENFACPRYFPQSLTHLVLRPWEEPSLRKLLRLLQSISKSLEDFVYEGSLGNTCGPTVSFVVNMPALKKLVIYPPSHQSSSSRLVILRHLECPSLHDLVWRPRADTILDEDYIPPSSIRSRIQILVPIISANRNLQCYISGNIFRFPVEFPDTFRLYPNMKTYIIPTPAEQYSLAAKVMLHGRMEYAKNIRHVEVYPDGGSDEDVIIIDSEPPTFPDDLIVTYLYGFCKYTDYHLYKTRGKYQRCFPL